MRDADDWTPHLQDGEEVLWQGQPDGRLFVLRSIEIVLIPFALIWTLVFFLGIGQQLLLFDVFSLIAAFFLAVGLWVSIGCFFHDQYTRRHTHYALTSKRALVAKTGFGLTISENAVAPGVALNYTPGRLDRIGFGPKRSILKIGGTPKGALEVWGVGDRVMCFRALENGAEVFELAQRIKEANAA